MTSDGRFLFDEQARAQRRVRIFAGAASLAAAVLMLLGAAHPLQLGIQDFWFSLRGDRDASPQVVIIGIDGRSLNAITERWPWPRDRYVELIEALNTAGAAAIGFDIAFSTHTAEDEAFARAMSAAGNVVFGMIFNGAGDRSPPGKQPPESMASHALPPLDDPHRAILPAPEVEPPSSVLADAAAAVGHVVLLPSADGALRRIPTLIQHGEGVYPSLAVQVARVYAGIPVDELAIKASNLQIGYADVPILQNGEAYFNWPTTELDRAFPIYSFVDVLRGDVGARELQGKAVLIGMTATGLDDRNFPFGLTLPGVLAHATFLDNFFNLTFLALPEWAFAVELGVFLAVTLLATLLFPRISTPLLMSTSGVLLVAILGFSFYLFVMEAVWWPPVYPCLAVLLPFATVIVMRLRSTEQEKDLAVSEARVASEGALEAQLEKGLAFQEKGSLDLAIATFAKLPMSDDMKTVYLSLGMDYQNRGNLEKAFLCYKRVYELDPNFEDVAKRMEVIRNQGMGTEMISPEMQDYQPTLIASPGTPQHANTSDHMRAQATGVGTPGVVSSAAALPPHSHLEPQPGAPGSRFRIIKKLGQGAFGEVSLAEDTKIGRKVAIKAMRPDINLASHEAIEMRQRFVREATTAGRLNHPNIVTVYDSFEAHDGAAYIVMEFVEGGSLGHYMKKGKLSVAQIKHIISSVASGLEYAHNNGVIHRDIKPDNIMISPKPGTVKIMDFGIARVLDSNMTATGSVLGTPSYMAPEQVTGKKVQAQSDVFSLGVIFYEMLVGERPFKGDSVTSLMFSIVQKEAPVPSSVAPAKVSPVWDPIVAKVLAKKPEDRYESVRAFAEAVRNASVK